MLSCAVSAASPAAARRASTRLLHRPPYLGGTTSPVRRFFGSIYEQSRARQQQQVRRCQRAGLLRSGCYCRLHSAGTRTVHTHRVDGSSRGVLDSVMRHSNKPEQVAVHPRRRRQRRRLDRRDTSRRSSARCAGGSGGPLTQDPREDR